MTIRRPPLGLLEFGDLPLHPLRRDPPELGGSYFQGEECQFRHVDAGAGRGGWMLLILF